MLDEGRRKPIILLALLQEGLKGSEAQREKKHTPPIDFVVSMGLAGTRIVRDQKRRTQKQGQDSQGDGDIEDPWPTEVIGQIATQCRTDGRSHNDTDRENHSCFGLILSWYRLKH